jgi:hypothetical protein
MLQLYYTVHFEICSPFELLFIGGKHFSVALFSLSRGKEFFFVKKKTYGKNYQNQLLANEIKILCYLHIYYTLLNSTLKLLLNRYLIL